MNSFKNLFEGMSWEEVALTVVGGTALALIVGILIVVAVSLLPLSDKVRLLVLFSSGLAIWFIGYEVLRRMPPKIHTKTAAMIRPTTPLTELWRGVKSIKRMFVHKPIDPAIATAIRNNPSMNVPNTIIAFIVKSLRKFIQVLHNVL